MGKLDQRRLKAEAGSFTRPKKPSEQKVNTKPEEETFILGTYRRDIALGVGMIFLSALVAVAFDFNWF